MEIRISFRSVLSVSTFIFCFFLASLSAANEKLELTHTVYLGGLYVGNVKTDITQTENNYKIVSRAKTNGTFNWLFDWAAKGQSQGLINKTKLVPERHIHQSAWNDNKRGAVIEYSPSGQVTYEIIGKGTDNINKYTPLDPAAVHHSMDPMSMIFTVSEKLQRGEECSGNYAIFDGRRRYDILLTAASKQLFGASEYSVFEGTAQGCKIEVKKMGGFKRVSNYEFSEEKDLVLWVGTPVEGGRIVPVRMRVATKFGSMEMHLAKYSSGATKLASKNAE